MPSVPRPVNSDLLPPGVDSQPSTKPWPDDWTLNSNATTHSYSVLRFTVYSKAGRSPSIKFQGKGGAGDSQHADLLSPVWLHRTVLPRAAFNVALN
jgi:hypothetical protein